jgi:hypothetical protein
MSYTLNVGKLYFTPVADYKYISDVIENYGHSDGGVYYSTYANTGHFAQISAGADLSYRFKWGRVYAGGGWKAYYFMGHNAKSSTYVSFVALDSGCLCLQTKSRLMYCKGSDMQHLELYLKVDNLSGRSCVC